MALDKKTILFYVLFFFTLLEVLCCTYFQKIEHHVSEITDHTTLGQLLGSNISSIGYILAGIVVAVIPLLYVSPAQVYQSKNSNKYVFWLMGSILLAASVYFLHAAYGVFSTQPIDFHNADMLPVIKVMNERWLNHGDVYAVINDFWPDEKPVYLPAMWMPFAPSVLLHFDMRCITLGAVLLGALFMVFSIRPSRFNWHSLIALFPVLYLVKFMLANTDYFRWTEEGVVVGFYMLLAFAVMRRNIWLQGIAISLCLLSRFSFAGWVPLFFIIQFFFVSRQQAIFTAFIAFAFSLMLLIWSQAIGHLPFLLSLSDHYLTSINNSDFRWVHQGTIIQGLGVAKWLPYTSLIWLQRTLEVITILFPIAGYCLYRWGKGINQEFFLIAMLKLYLVIFYNMLILPYYYLFFTSTFLSCFILYRYSKGVIWNRA